MKNALGFVIGLLALVSTPTTWGQNDPIVTSDLLKIRVVTSIDVSDDGARAVFTVKSITSTPGEDDQGERHEYRSHLYALDLFDLEAQAVQLTHGNRRDTSPVLSPDGTRLAFVRAAEEGNNSQGWIIPLGGGRGAANHHLGARRVQSRLVPGRA